MTIYTKIHQEQNKIISDLNEFLTTSELHANEIDNKDVAETVETASKLLEEIRGKLYNILGHVTKIEMQKSIKVNPE